MQRRSVRPITRPASTVVCLALVTPRMTVTNTKVATVSVMKAAAVE